MEAYQAVNLDGRAGSRLDESVHGVQAVVIVVGALDLEGDATLPRDAQLVQGHSSGGGDLRTAWLDGGSVHAGLLLVPRVAGWMACDRGREHLQRRAERP